MAQDSGRPEFWDTRYRDHVMPWDAGQVPAQAVQYFSALRPPRRVLIPGCGSGYEVAVLARAGFDVMAIDFSAAALERARACVPEFADRLLLADFFDFSPGGEGFDVMYERAFLCALPRDLWAAYGARSAELLRPGGVIAGYWFFDDNQRGPPFGASEDTLAHCLGSAFRRIDDTPVTDSAPVFAGKERWQVWERVAPR